MKSGFLIIGPTGSGKSSLVNVIEQKEGKVHKTVVPEYHSVCLDTPGEYLAHRAYYGNLQVVSTACGIVVLLIACNASNANIAPRLMDIFNGKKKIGVVSKIDMGTPEMIERCEKTLLRAGVEKIYHITIKDISTIHALCEELGLE